MTEHYYSLEDEPDINNPDTALDLWQQEAASLADYPSQAQQAFNEIAETITPWYEDAVAQNDAPLQQQLITIHSRAQQLTEQVARLDALAAGAAATLKTVNEQRYKTVAELEDITEALESFDSDHPKLSDFAEIIWEDSIEHLQEMESLWLDDQADERFAEHSYNTLYNRLHLLGFADDTISALRDALIDEDNEEGAWNAERIELLAELARSFESSIVPVDLDAEPEEG